MFEPGNQLARKPEDQLSQTQDAINGRKRRDAAKAKTEAERRREVAAKVGKRAAMVAKFGEARVLAWESFRLAGTIVWDLLQFFFEDWPTITTDENVDQHIDL